MAKKRQAGAKPVVSDAAIAAKTGKSWEQWFTALDKAGAAKCDHKAIVAILNGRMKVGPWWGQMVAVSYERARGLRAVNQKGDGEFSVGVSRVMDAALAKLFATATGRRTSWFPKGKFVETSRTANKYWRGEWKKGGRLEINFYAKGAGKTQIVVQTNRLASPDAVESERAAWKKALEELKSIL